MIPTIPGIGLALLTTIYNHKDEHMGQAQSDYETANHIPKTELLFTLIHFVWANPLTDA